MGASRNTVAVLLILALIFAGIGVGIAINNYQTVNAAAFKEIVTAEPVEGQSQVAVIVRPPEGESDSGG